jgi:threonine synthase
MYDMETAEEFDIFRRRVGNTPLLRCKRLEQKLGVGRLFAKLEGTNPTGHKSDRIAHRIVRDANQKGYGTLTIGTVGYLARSLSYLSEPFGLRCKFFVPKVSSGYEEYVGEASNVDLVMIDGTWEEAVAESRRKAKAEGWYDANPGLDNNTFGMIAYSPMALELVRKLGGPPDTISTPVGSGSLLSGLHLGFRQLWSLEEVDHLPRIFGGSLEGANAIIESIRKGHQEVEPISADGDVEASHQPLINYQALFGQPALEALQDCDGAGYGLTESELEELVMTIRNCEHIELTVDSAAALGAFMQANSEGLVNDGGNHVLVLSTGRTDLTITELTRKDIGDNLGRLIDILDRWLEDFSDPKEEILEAVENALNNGYVLAALMNGGLVGLCVLSTMELDTFFPRYHLAYIAADERYEGRGVATLLIEKAVEVSNGNLSLHVERDNDKAIRLYKKMGFDIKYHRMQFMTGGHE